MNVLVRKMAVKKHEEIIIDDIDPASEYEVGDNDGC